MHYQELPLVFFTIMAQMSVGCFVTLGVIHVIAGRKLGIEQADRLSDPALYAIGPVMVLALAVSILHLGNPINAVYAVNHMSSSWLSREIFFGCAFAGAGAAFALCQKIRWFTPVVRQLLGVFTAAIGLVLVFAMSKVYMLPTVPGWNSWATPVTFYTTTLLLGGLAVGAAFIALLALARRGRYELDEDLTRALRRCVHAIASASIALLGVEFVVLPTYGLQLAREGGVAAQSAQALLYAGGAVVIARLVLVFLGAGLLGQFVFSAARTGRDRVVSYAITSAFFLVLASELLGRLLFYTSFHRIGL
jgi:anaerobic dimethyl sulfoxide reductase subunit C (anchor subunit)